MVVFYGEHMYVIPQSTIVALGLENAQLFFDAGKIDGATFIEMLHEAELEVEG